MRFRHTALCRAEPLMARPGERRSMEVVYMLARDSALLQRIEEMRRVELAKVEERERARRERRRWAW